MGKNTKIRNKVKLARIEQGSLTQTDLAIIIGVTRQTINLIEKEKYNPSIKLCLKISKVLAVPLDELFWLEGDES